MERGKTKYKKLFRLCWIWIIFLENCCIWILSAYPTLVYAFYYHLRFY